MEPLPHSPSTLVLRGNSGPFNQVERNYLPIMLSQPCYSRPPLAYAP